MAAQAQVDEKRLNSFLRHMLGDMGATLSAALVIVGDRLGLYKALADAGPMTAATIGSRTAGDPCAVVAAQKQSERFDAKATKDARSQRWRRSCIASKRRPCIEALFTIHLRFLRAITGKPENS